MQFNPMGFMLASAMTADLPDRSRAAQIDILGGMLGPNPAGAVLLAVAAREGGSGSGTTTTAPSGGGAVTPARVQVPELPDDPGRAKKVIESRGLVAASAEVASGEPIGGVIGADPEIGAIVSVGSTVTILVSAGLEVPDVVGKEFDEAESILRNAGFEEEIERVESERSGAEDVIDAQEPAAGSFADAASTVTLYVFGAKPRLHSARSSGKE